MGWILWVVALSLVLSFLFSASETALTSLGRMEINRFRAAGGNVYKLIRHWVKTPNRYLTTVLVGNNIANIAASSLLTFWVQKHYEMALGWVMAVFTISVIVFLEVIPKILARQLAMNLAPYAMRFLIGVRYVLYPIVHLLTRFSIRFIGLLGTPGRGQVQPISEEELTSTIQMAAREGGIDRETGEALENLLEFADTRAKDVMTPRTKIASVSLGMSLMDVMQTVATARFSRYPVMKGSLDEVVGVLLVKDLLAFLRRGGVGSWTKIIHRPTWESEMAPLGALLRDMKRTGTHLMLIRDERGILSGLVTFEDIIEEIVGEVRDEDDDPSEAGTEKALGGPQLVDGEIAIVDFNSRFQAELPQDMSYSTLNGYILSKTGGHMPPIGTLIFDDDFTFRIQAISDIGVATVEVVAKEA